MHLGKRELNQPELSSESRLRRNSQPHPQILILYNLPRCTQCAQAYYCNAACQRKHWRKHKPVCRAAVAALARRATRERLARAVREKGKDNVEGAEEDTLCVICQARPVDPVEVRSCDI